MKRTQILAILALSLALGFTAPIANVFAEGENIEAITLDGSAGEDESMNEDIVEDSEEAEESEDADESVEDATVEEENEAITYAGADGGGR